MLKLTARIRVQRLFGSLEKVASEGSGGPLQAKTAWPSHDEQVIAPDEDYYGLVSVKIMPVPRLPACVMSAKSDTNNIVDHVIGINAEMSAEGSEYIQTHAEYDGARLPLLPADVLAQYPYAFIYKIRNSDTYRVVFSTGIWWWNDNGDRGMNQTVTESCPVYEATLSSDTWGFLENSTKNFIKFAYFNVWDLTFVWTNFNVPNGSVTATSYYKKATEPGLIL